MKPPALKLQQVAELAGVSITTVSLALRNHPRIPLKTRQHIQKIAIEAGYRRNPLVSAHMSLLRTLKNSNNGNCINFISHFGRSHLLDKNHSEGFVLGAIEERAAELAFSVDFHHVDQSLTESRLNRLLKYKQSAGLIVGPLRMPVSTLPIDWPVFASAAYGYSLSSPRIPRVCHDYFAGTYELMSALHQLGYRRVGFVSDHETDVRTNHLIDAALSYQLEHLPEMQRISSLITELYLSWSEHDLLSWMEREKPDVVVSTELRSYVLLKKNGYRIPQDVGCCGIVWRASAPEMSGIKENNLQIGRSLVELVAEQLYRNERGIPPCPQTISIQGNWFAGTTTRRQPGSKNHG